MKGNEAAGMDNVVNEFIIDSSTDVKSVII